MLRITVTDDGSGYSGVEPEEGGGIGHMHTRAALIGANLRVEPAPERGTRVSVEIALENAAPAPVAPEAELLEQA
jgi:signal transduction histidine kinase